MDVTFTTVPLRRSLIEGSTACIIRTAPKKFVSNIRRTGSSGTISTAPARPTPALFTSTSIAPASFRTSATHARTFSSWSTSSFTGSIFSRFSIGSGFRAPAKTRYPRSAKQNAVSSPIPVLVPVTSAVSIPQPYHSGPGSPQSEREAGVPGRCDLSGRKRLVHAKLKASVAGGLSQALFDSSQLLFPKDDHGIYARCTPGRNVAGNHRYHQKGGDSQGENRRISGPY